MAAIRMKNRNRYKPTDQTDRFHMTITQYCINPTLPPPRTGLGSPISHPLTFTASTQG